MSCLQCAVNPDFLKLQVGQKIEVKAWCGFPQLRKKTTLVIYRISGYSLITTSGQAFMASDMDHITPLNEFVQNPKLDGKLAEKRMSRFS